MQRVLRRLRMLPLVIGSCLLMACSGGAVEGGGGSGGAGIGIYLSPALQSDLSMMEEEAYLSISALGGGDMTASPYLADLNEVVARLNSYLPAMAAIRPELNLLLLQSGPPRLTGTAALYLCNGMGFPAATMHRSIFVSHSFIGSLWLEAANWGAPELFRPSLAYLVYHEFAHAALGHSAMLLSGGGGQRFAVPEEAEADSLAYDILVATGYNPMGMVIANSLVGGAGQQ